MVKPTSTQASDGNGIKKRRRRAPPTLAPYLHKLMLEEDAKPDELKDTAFTVKIDALKVMNAIVTDFVERMVDESLNMARARNKTTMQSKHAHAAAKIMFGPGRLGAFVCANAEQALGRLAAAR